VPDQIVGRFVSIQRETSKLGLFHLRFAARGPRALHLRRLTKSLWLPANIIAAQRHLTWNRPTAGLLVSKARKRVPSTNKNALQILASFGDFKAQGPRKGIAAAGRRTERRNRKKKTTRYDFWKQRGQACCDARARAPDPPGLLCTTVRRRCPSRQPRQTAGQRAQIAGNGQQNQGGAASN